MAEITPTENTGSIYPTRGGSDSAKKSDPFCLAHSVDFAANQTGVVIWTPAIDNRFVIVGYHVSFTADGVISIWQGEYETPLTRIFKHNGAVQGGVAMQLPLPLPARANDSVLCYTTDATAVGYLTIFGYDSRQD